MKKVRVAGLVGMLACATLACASLGSGERGGRTLAKLSAASLQESFQLTGQAADGEPLRFASDGRGHWTWRSRQEAFGRDERGLWTWQGGGPVRRVGFSLAAELELRGWMWSGGATPLDGFRVLETQPGQLELWRPDQEQPHRIALDEQGRLKSWNAPSGRGLEFGGWTRSGNERWPRSGRELAAGDRSRAFELSEFQVGPVDCSPPQDGRATVVDPEVAADVPLRRTRAGRWLIEGRLPDGSSLGWFLVDTGAGPTCVNRRFVEDLDLPTTRSRDVQTLGGTVAGEVVRGLPLRLGPLTLESHEWILLELGPLAGDAGFELAGILGAAFFQSCRVEVPPEGDWLYLKASIPPPPDSHPILFDGDLPCVQAQIEGRSAWLRLDTGASDTLILHAPFVRRAGLLQGDRRTRPATLQGLGGAERVERGPLEEGELAGVSLRNVEASLSLARRGVLAQAEPEGLVGLGLLGHRRLILDLGGGWWSWPVR